MMILITGATGHFGKATIASLLKQGTPANNIAALVRDPAKAEDLKSEGIEIRVGNFDDYNSLVAAFAGVDKLLLVSTNEIENRSKQHENAVKAAVEAGVKYVAYTSFLRKNETDTSPIYFIAESHLDTEHYLEHSGLKYTILKNTLYADVLPMFLGNDVLNTGINLPAGNTKATFATREDMAEATAKVLEIAEPKTEYLITNLEAYSMDDIAGMLTAISGKQVANVNPPADEYVAALKQAQVPAEFVGMLAGFSEGIKQGEFTETSKDLETILGRKPTSLKAYLQSVYHPVA